MAVAADDWYQRRRSDPTGRYFRYIVEQVQPPLDLKSTLQGIYVFTASGRLLAHRSSGKHVGLTRDVLQQGLKGWRSLPAKHTQPGAFKLPQMDDNVWDRRHDPLVPAGGLVIDVTTRALQRDQAGNLSTCQSTEAKARVGTRPAYDHAWLTKDEVEAITIAAESADQFEIPAAITWRLARFHLVDNTRGEPDHWKWAHVQELELRGKRVETSAQKMLVDLVGSFSLATDANRDSATRGYVGDWRGELRIDLDNRTIDHIRLVAIGDHWGQGRWTPPARPGKTPLGVLMMLSDQSSPRDTVPPQAARSPDRYFNAELNR